MTVNKAILVGNLGADPELRTRSAGTAVATLRIATTERRRDREGKWGDHTEWHRVVCFGKTAENVGLYCRKGKTVYVEGRFQTRKWEDADGQERWTTEVVAQSVRFLGGREARPDREPREAVVRPSPPHASGGFPDDIPF